MKVLIVGGVAGGASAAARIRRLDENAEIVIFERSGYISYANCGLPYYIGGEIEKESSLTLNTPEAFAGRFNVDVRVNADVIAVDSNNKSVCVRNVLTGETYGEKYDKLILSPGARPFRPPVDGIESGRIFTLRTVNDTINIKRYVVENGIKSAVVVGAGFIGVEMAENLVNLGINTTVVEKIDQVLAPFDYEMACYIQGHMKEKGVRLCLGTSVMAFEDTEDEIFVVTDKYGKIGSQIVILAVGVVPDTSFLDGSGIKMGAKNSISVDENMRTNIKDIYAVGDAVEIKNIVTGKDTLVPLAGPANKQGRIAADNICGINSIYKGAQGSSVLKVFDLTAASTGINERQAKIEGLNYDIAILCPPSHATYYPNSKDLVMKVIFSRESGVILGAQVIGEEGADKRCDVLACAVRGKLTAHDLTELELCYAPPFSSAKDPVNMAGYLIENLLSGRVKQIHYCDIDGLDREKYFILDVRKDNEFEEGHIEGAYHMPLDDLRERIGEINGAKGKIICVCCKTGVRSYNAYRFLTQNGFDCINTAGGYYFYSGVKKGLFDNAPHHSCGIKIE